MLEITTLSHNPYFSGNLFAIRIIPRPRRRLLSHNPYFSGNLFAILEGAVECFWIEESQSLF